MSLTEVETQQQVAIAADPKATPNGVNAENRAFVLLKKGEFSYENRPIPDLPSDKHVIVAVKATGLCGSDIHYWTHGEIGDFKVRKPIVLGHESAGVVYKCGAAVMTLKVGDEVAMEPGVPCRSCSYCRSGRYNLCPDVVFAATPPHDGTLATYYTVPEDFCYKLPNGVSLEEGALLEPLSVAVHCAKLANLSFGSSVLVLGAGPIGLLCGATARALGSSRVAVVDIVQSRLDFALGYGATDVYKMENVSPEENASKLLLQVDKPLGFEVVIDATGAQPCIITGIHALQRGGRFIQAGLGAPNINFPVGQLCSKEGMYIGSFRYGPGDYETAVQLLEQGKVQVKDLITHRYSFDEAEKAFENVVQRNGIKTVIAGPSV